MIRMTNQTQRLNVLYDFVSKCMMTPEVFTVSQFRMVFQLYRWRLSPCVRSYNVIRKGQTIANISW